MKRKRATLLLMALAVLMSGRVSGHSRRRVTDIQVVALVAVRNSVPARLCPGSANTLRVSLTWHGTLPTRPVPIRLVLTTPGGHPGGTMVAEGSVALRPDGSVTTFTFLHVEVAERLRGRDARLVARANADGLIPENDFSNNDRELLVDNETDWSCNARTSSGRQE